MSTDWRGELQSAWDAAWARDGQQSRMRVLGQLCVAQLAAAGVAVTVLSDTDSGSEPSRGLVFATDTVSGELARLQLTVGEGPCRQAFLTGEPVLISDVTAAADRWLGFTDQAVALGAAVVCAFPLQLGARRLGVLECYRRQPGPLSTRQARDGRVLAEWAGQLVQAELASREPADTRWLADSYEQVQQAVGMVRSQLHTTAETAWLRLRAYAYTQDQPVTEIARHVLTRQLHFER